MLEEGEAIRDDSAEETLSVIAQAGRREFGVGPHLMWASLEISNSNPRRALTDVQVRVVDCEKVEQALQLVEVTEEPGLQRSEVVPNTFKVLGQILGDWIPVHILWDPNQSVATTIPPAASRTIVVAFSDDSNGPPGIINDRTHTHLHVENRITVEVSSPDMAAWKGQFFIRCHPQYVYGDWAQGMSMAIAGLGTPARFEFERWEDWSSTRRPLSR